MSERFWSKVTKTPTCWLWSAAKDHYGYGAFGVSVGGKRMMVKAHRHAYELCVGRIPKGLVIDHRCRNRACVNPAHLETVTNRENIVRGEGPAKIGAFHKAKTQCPHGHPYEPKNTYVAKNGQRQCRACSSARMRMRRSIARGVEGTMAK